MSKDVVFEALKEVARWVVLFLISWFVSQTLSQATAVPESYVLKVWVFAYMIPVRTLLTLALTAIGRWADRLVHDSKTIKLEGLLPF